MTRLLCYFQKDTLQYEIILRDFSPLEEGLFRDDLHALVMRYKDPIQEAQK